MNKYIIAIFAVLLFTSASAFRFHARQGGPGAGGPPGGPGGDATADLGEAGTAATAEGALDGVGEQTGLGDAEGLETELGFEGGDDQLGLGAALELDVGDDGEPTEEEIFGALLLFGFCSMDSSEVLEGDYIDIDSDDFNECLQEIIGDDEAGAPERLQMQARKLLRR